MINICLINGSPRGNKSCSQMFSNEIAKLRNEIQCDVTEISVLDSLRTGRCEEEYQQISDMDIVVFIFPLYIDCLPSILLEFMSGFEEWLNNNKIYKEKSIERKPRIYAITNCGFLEGTQNKHALRIIESFAVKLGLQWRFGLGIGAGEFLRETVQNIPMESKIKSKVNEALKVLKNDISDLAEGQKENILVNPSMPRLLYLYAGNRSWVSWAKKNSLTKKQLYSKPAL